MLVNLEDASLHFLNQTLYEAELVVPIDSQEDDATGKASAEYLLVFQNLGIYVDSNGFLFRLHKIWNVFLSGRRSRAQELLFPCKSTYPCRFQKPYLCHFSEHQIFVFDTRTAEWIQTINLRNARPLDRRGLFILCQVLDNPHIVLLNTHAKCALRMLDFRHKWFGLVTEGKFIIQPAASRNIPSLQRRNRKFSVKTSAETMYLWLFVCF